MSDTELKAKRRLTDISFEKMGCHVALVGPSVGSAANGYTTLIMKAVDDIPEEIVEKATQVQVTMSFDEFLVKFFNMYYEDAEVLAKVLGFEEDEEDEMPSDMYDYQGGMREEKRKYKEWINERASAISIMKDVYASEDVNKAFNALSYEDSLAIIETQEMLEKAMSSVKSEGDNVSVNKAEMDSPSTHNKEDNEMEMIQKALHKELVEKAVNEAVNVVKAELAAQTEILKAAQEELAVFKAKELEAIVKARKAALASVLPEDKVEEMFKATQLLADDAFDVIVKSMAAQNKALEESDLFKEAGVPGDAEQDQVQKDGTAAILKAKYQNKKGVKK